MAARLATLSALTEEAEGAVVVIANEPKLSE